VPRPLIVIQIGVMIAVAALALTIGAATGIAIALMLAGTLPLLLAIPGLRLGSIYTYQWLSIVAVLYVGIGLAEMIASLGQSRAAIALTLTSSVLLIALLRAIKHRRQVSRESTGS